MVSMHPKIGQFSLPACYPDSRYLFKRRSGGQYRVEAAINLGIVYYCGRRSDGLGDTRRSRAGDRWVTIGVLGPDFSSRISDLQQRLRLMLFLLVKRQGTAEANPLVRYCTLAFSVMAARARRVSCSILATFGLQCFINPSRLVNRFNYVVTFDGLLSPPHELSHALSAVIVDRRNL